MPNGNKPPIVNINVKDLERVKCICGSIRFSNAIELYHISALQSPTGKEGQVAKIIGYVCIDCGEINNIQKPTGKNNPFGFEVSGSGRVE